MSQTAEEDTKYVQAQVISEFPQLCRDYINERLSRGKDVTYDPKEYAKFVWVIVRARDHMNSSGVLESPEFKSEWGLGMESQLEEAWNAELAKIKEATLKLAREKIPHVCVVMINGYCDDLLYPDLEESTFERLIRNLHVGGNLRNFQDSWKEDLRGDIEAAWEAEILKAKDDKRIPATLDDAFKLAWAYMERTNPFEHHDKITLRGLGYALINLVMKYQDNLWDTWPDKVSFHVLIDSIPLELIDELKSLYREINGRGE